MKLPSRLSLALGMLITGALAISQEVTLDHPVKMAIALAAGVLLFLLHPEERGVISAHEELPPPPPNVLSSTPPAP